MRSTAVKQHFGLFFLLLASLSGRSTPGSYAQKLELIDEIYRYGSSFTIGLGSGFNAFVTPQSESRLTYPTRDMQFGISIKTTPDNFIYQGFTWNVSPLLPGPVHISNSRIPWATHAEGIIYHFSYLVSYRIYNVIHTFRGIWTYKYASFGGGPCMYIYSDNPKWRLFGVYRDDTSKKFGLSGFVALHFAHNHSPICYGIELRLTDIFSYPDLSDDSYRFYSPFRFHQQHAFLLFRITYNHENKPLW